MKNAELYWDVYQDGYDPKKEKRIGFLDLQGANFYEDLCKCDLIRREAWFNGREWFRPPVKGTQPCYYEPIFDRNIEFGFLTKEARLQWNEFGFIPNRSLKQGDKFLFNIEVSKFMSRKQTKVICKNV